MTDDDHRALAEALLPVVLAAGSIEMRYFKKGVTVENKFDDSPVTAADREAEELITEALGRIMPGVPVIGEEAASQGTLPEVADTFFLVDPLDGTRDFIARRKEFTVNIALVVAGQPLFGVVYQPPTGRLFLSTGAHVAFEAEVAADSSARHLADLALTPIRPRKADRDNLRVAVSRSNQSTQLQSRLRKFGMSDQLVAGSSLKFCLVARGEADLYPRITSISEWDTAAGQAVLQAAGGCVVGLDNGPLGYGNADKGFRVAPFVAWGDGRLAPEFSFL